MVRFVVISCVAVVGLGIFVPAQTQTQQASPQPQSQPQQFPAPAQPQIQQAPAQSAVPVNLQQVHQKLGVFVYPAHHQNGTKQNADEQQCYTWARGQTGIDPTAPPPQSTQTADTEQPPSSAGKGHIAKGAAGGALAGTAIGAIAGGTGTGAAIGATAGAMGGAVRRRQAKKAAEQQQQQAQQQAQQQLQLQEQQRLGTFKKAYAACLQGRGYSVQ